MKRRAFLQVSATYLTALGVGDLLLGRTQPTWAASSGRKLALLIGIDRYAQNALRGCGTDVALQEQLLVHRFGFAPEALIKLTNQAATLTAIKQAFGSTLHQLQPDDLLLVHFSGKGTIDLAQQPTLLLAEDATLPLTELARLLNACGTRRMITILDTCYQTQGRAMLGNQRVRSRISTDAVSIATQSVATQSVATASMATVANAALPGIVLSAAIPDQLAVEVDYPDFSAGRFTYGLTQALWQLPAKTNPNESILGTVSGHSADLKLLSGLATASIMPPSIGALLTLDRTGRTGDLWLGGLPAAKVATVNAQALLKASSGQTLQVVSRQGLKAAVRIKDQNVTANPLTLDSAIAEQLRTIPHDLAVQIAIDGSLSKVERVDAVGALSGLSNVSTKLIGEGATDYILTKAQPAESASNLVTALPDTPMKDLAPASYYALFTADHQPISTTSVESDEAVKTTVKRFAPIIEALYADKVLSLLENRDAANLAVSVEGDRLTPQPKLLFRQSTRLVPGSNTDMATLPSLAVGTQLRYRVTNQSATPLYWLLVGWNSRHDTYVVLPPVEQASAVLAVGQTVVLPLGERGTEWSIRGPAGDATVYLVMSDRPFTQTIEALKHLNLVQPETYLHALLHPLTVIQAMLKDLSVPEFEAPDIYGVDMNRYVVIPLAYRIA